MKGILKRMHAGWRQVVRRMKEGKKGIDKHLMPLAAVYPGMDNNKEYKVYSEYLSKAFKNPSIRNIAITGNFGIGKSCFLNEWSKKKKYLFISLCSFSHQKSECLESNMLQQVLLGCGCDIKKKNQIINRRNNILIRIMLTIFGLIISLTVYFLLFFEIFKGTLSGFDVTPSEQTITRIECAVYGLFSICLVVGLTFFWYKLVNQFTLSKVVVKLSNVEMETECKENATVSYMERYRIDLVCALHQAARKIDYTIVFEDMDRLESEECRHLFTELREINRLVNSGKYGKKAKKTIRFVYAVHDAIFCDESATKDLNDSFLHLKFFDYIMPIVPALVDKSSLNYIVECFEMVGFRHMRFVYEIAGFLSDYRLIKNITNEYVVLRDIYVERNGESAQFDSQDEQQLMALAIYKVIMPLDYKRIREGNSQVFLGRGAEHVVDNFEVKEIVKCLRTNGWLSPQCLKFIGYDYDEIRKYGYRIFSTDKLVSEYDNEVMRSMLRSEFILCMSVIIEKLKQQEDMTECLSNVCYTILEVILRENRIEYFETYLVTVQEHLLYTKEKCQQIHIDALNEFMRSISHDALEQAASKIYRVIDYLVKIDHKDYRWFLVKNDAKCDCDLDELRWSVLFSLDISALERLILRCDNYLAEWINLFSESRGIPVRWDKYFREDNAKVLSKLKLDEEVINYLNS